MIAEFGSRSFVTHTTGLVERVRKAERMSKQKRIENICRNFQRKMQKIVDGDDGITSISIVVDGEKHTIAEKIKGKKEDA